MIQQDQRIYNDNLPYEVKPFITQKEKTRCYSMAINSDNNLVIVGSGYYIKVFEIQQTTLNELQVLDEHKQLVLCLSFFSKSSQTRSFISAADTIIIWQEQNRKWIVQNQLRIQEDKTQIQSLVIHPQEDLIFCGSRDNIQFWFQNLNAESDEIQQQKQQQEWICKPYQYSNIFGLSINQKGDRLIACGTGQEILVMAGNNTTEWKVVEKISTNAYGLRLCFITNDVIAFQERGSRPHDQLQFYSLNSKEKLNQSNVKGGEQACNSLFPLSYIQSKQLIIDRNGYCVNVVSIRQENQYQFQTNVVQYFQFQTEYIYGTVSNDGNLLILWNDQEEEIQIRIFNASYY
ncbi:unnamed protein product [Paramecium sonneborni]|uniref:WD40-repeat-containing domain n=1 Tax=Paramecium sonneborni TaxID=65129 RepID=A0A8S1R6C5_9CILI|nr:unnamed protein product [Paramecium sonneborni]